MDVNAIERKLNEIDSLANSHGNWSRKAVREQYAKWFRQAVDDIRYELHKGDDNGQG